MNIKIDYQINELQEVCTLIRKASDRKKGDPIHLIKNKHKFTLSEEEVNKRYHKIYKFYESVYNETIDVLKEYEDLIPYIQLPSSSSECSFIFAAIRNINCKSVNELELNNFLYGCNYELTCMDATDEGFEQTQVDEIAKELERLKVMGNNYNEIFTLVNKTDLQANHKIILLNFYQQISTIYVRLVKVLTLCTEIYERHINEIQYMIHHTIEKFYNEDGELLDIEKLEISKYVDFNETSFRKDEFIYLSCSVMNAESMSLTMSMDKTIPITLVAGVLYYELNSLINDEVMKEQLFLEQMKAIGDSSRLKIMKLLSIKPFYIKEIAEETALTSATISHHMGILLKAKLVLVYNDGRKTYYRVNKEEMNQLSQVFTDLSGEETCRI